MDDSNRKRKALVLSLCLVLVLEMMIPKNARAQFGGGMLGYGFASEQQYYGGVLGSASSQGGYHLTNQQFGVITLGGYQLSNQTFGQDAPLGSGIFILTAAAAGFALRKRKYNDNNQKS